MSPTFPHICPHCGRDYQGESLPALGRFMACPAEDCPGPWYAPQAEAVNRLGLPVYWLGLGRVTDPESHDGRAAEGAPEWQFSDGPAGARSYSCDFLSLAEGLAALGPCVVIPDGLADTLAGFHVTAPNATPAEIEAGPRAASLGVNPEALAAEVGPLTRLADLGRELAEARAILAEVLADICDPESGNPWRLESMKRAAAFLTGDALGYSPGPVMLARLIRGTLGGRFRPPYCGPEFDSLGRLAADLAEMTRKESGRAQWLERLKAAATLADDPAERAEAAEAVTRAESDLAGVRVALARSKAAHAAEVERLKAGGLIQ